MHHCFAIIDVKFFVDFRNGICVKIGLELALALVSEVGLFQFFLSKVLKNFPKKFRDLKFFQISDPRELRNYNPKSIT